VQAHIALRLNARAVLINTTDEILAYIQFSKQRNTIPNVKPVVWRRVSIGTICVENKLVVVVSKIMTQLLLLVYRNRFNYICPHIIFIAPEMGSAG
jgi:hypothetical protein